MHACCCTLLHELQGSHGWCMFCNLRISTRSVSQWSEELANYHFANTVCTLVFMGLQVMVAFYPCLCLGECCCWSLSAADDDCDLLYILWIAALLPCRSMARNEADEFFLLQQPPSPSSSSDRPSIVWCRGSSIERDLKYAGR